MLITLERGSVRTQAQPAAELWLGLVPRVSLAQTRNGLGAQGRRARRERGQGAEYVGGDGTGTQQGGLESEVHLVQRYRDQRTDTQPLEESGHRGGKT